MIKQNLVEDLIAVFKKHHQIQLTTIEEWADSQGRVYTSLIAVIGAFVDMFSAGLKGHMKKDYLEETQQHFKDKIDVVFEYLKGKE